MERPSDNAAWVAHALAAVGLVTGLRLVLLAFNRTDLFVDESQYWLWGQNLAFGYFSKPPLIGLLIRVATTLAGSDAVFWVRMPGAVLHGATAMVLGALAARLYGAQAAFWVAVSYVTTPFSTVGSLLISTDTVMAPAYATALWGWFRLVETRALRFALLTGAAVGAACMAKYAGAYFLLGAGLSALVLPSMRIGWRNTALLLATFAVVIAPNVVWNLTHELATVHHTMSNIEPEDADEIQQGPSIEELYDFVGGQFAVFGPILFGAFLLASVSALRRAWGSAQSALVMFSLPVLLIICVQALLSRAYANWALATYFAGTLLVVPYLLARAPRLLPVSVAINGAFALLLPILTITAPSPQWHGRPLLHRYLGRTELSQQIIAAAQQVGVSVVQADDRDVLADLFYTGRTSGLRFYSDPPNGPPESYYEQMFPIPADSGPTLYVLEEAPLCGGIPVQPVIQFDTSAGAYSKERYAGYILPDGCPFADD